MTNSGPQNCSVRAWKPDVAGVAEVFHAHIVDWSYPVHCHDTWTVLLVESGAIRFNLDKKERNVSGSVVTLVPPGVLHDGKPAPGTREGFWKRNLYLNEDFLPTNLVGKAVDQTNLNDPVLRRTFESIHNGIETEDPLFTEERLVLAAKRIANHLTLANQVDAQPRPEQTIAIALRELLDERIVAGVSLAEAQSLLNRSRAHLIRSFHSTFDTTPHAYLTSQRVEQARHLLLDGVPPSEAATQAGFYDQSHLTRHFKRHTASTPAKYASGKR